MRKRLTQLTVQERHRFFSMVLSRLFNIPIASHSNVDEELAAKGLLNEAHALEDSTVISVMMEALAHPILTDSSRALNPLAYLTKRHAQLLKEYKLRSTGGNVMTNYRLLLKKYPMVDIARHAEAEFMRAKQEPEKFNSAKFFGRLCLLLEKQPLIREL